MVCIDILLSDNGVLSSSIAESEHTNGQAMTSRLLIPDDIHIHLIDTDRLGVEW